jgi:hypothetical protein
VAEFLHHAKSHCHAAGDVGDLGEIGIDAHRDEAGAALRSSGLIQIKGDRVAGRIMNHTRIPHRTGRGALRGRRFHGDDRRILQS